MEIEIKKRMFKKQVIKECVNDSGRVCENEGQICKCMIYHGDPRMPMNFR